MPGCAVCARVDRFVSSATTAFLGCLSKFILLALNSTTIVGAPHLHAAVRLRNPPRASVAVDGAGHGNHAQRRPQKRQRRGLITVSNHVSAVDDPGVVAVMLPWPWLFESALLRSTPCAVDRCFANPVVEWWLRKGKVLPIARGGGLYHPYMTDLVRRVGAGEWVQFFPEGTRARLKPDGDEVARSAPTGAPVARVKMGIGRLVADPAVTPIVVPFYHRGMQNVLGIGEYNFVSSGKRVVVDVGCPIDFTDLLQAHKEVEAAGPSSAAARKQRKEQLYRDIAARVEDALKNLKQRQEHRTASATSFRRGHPR